jgi:acyl-CoA thioester hydrolase
MDAYGHVNNVVFLTYLEEARVEMFSELSPEGAGGTVRTHGGGDRTHASVGAALDEGGLLSSGVVVARSEIDYKLPLVHRYDPVPIDVWVSRIGGASFTLRYEVHDESGAVFATAASTMVTFDFGAGKPRRIQPHERAFLERHFEADPAK